MEEWKLPVSAILGKELQAAMAKIHDLADLLENQIDVDSSIIANVTSSLAEAQAEVDIHKQVIVQLESEIARLTARIRNLEGQEQA